MFLRFFDPDTKHLISGVGKEIVTCYFIDKQCPHYDFQNADDEFTFNLMYEKGLLKKEIEDTLDNDGKIVYSENYPTITLEGIDINKLGGWITYLDKEKAKEKSIINWNIIKNWMYIILGVFTVIGVIIAYLAYITQQSTEKRETESQQKQQKTLPHKEQLKPYFPQHIDSVYSLQDSTKSALPSKK